MHWTYLIRITSLIIFFRFLSYQINYCPCILFDRLSTVTCNVFWYTIYSQFNSFLVFDCSIFLLTGRYHYIHYICFVALSLSVIMIKKRLSVIGRLEVLFAVEMSFLTFCSLDLVHLGFQVLHYLLTQNRAVYSLYSLCFLYIISYKRLYF